VSWFILSGERFHKVASRQEHFQKLTVLRQRGKSLLWACESAILLHLTMSLLQRFGTGRWRWAAEGFPSIARSRALFNAAPYTMSTPRRGRVLWELTMETLRKDVQGCLVECGVWRGGSAAIMGMASRSAGKNRVLHLFDSFEGLPEPDEKDGASAKIYSGGKASGSLTSIRECAATLEEVKSMFKNCTSLPESQLRFHVGWFQHTVPADAKNLGPIAVLRLDGDWYESTRVCLDHLYPLLSSGGALLLDDYFAWEGCRKATDEYRSQHGISTPMTQLDADSGYWIKQ
jgi:O-methyltransferase